MQAAEAFDFGAVGVDHPGPAPVVLPMGGDPALLDPAEERDAGHADLAGEVAGPPVVGAEGLGVSAEALFLLADTAQLAQQVADALSAEVFVRGESLDRARVIVCPARSWFFRMRHHLR